jgi:ApaG protein
MIVDNKHHIEVIAESLYLEEQSDVEEQRFVFAYHIRISNRGDEPVRLISRHWIIADADNQIQEVKGKGVIGEQPRLSPGETFEYSSGTVLTTPVGTMRGSYQMQTDDGTIFEAEIPEFLLSTPRVLH